MKKLFLIVIGCIIMSKVSCLYAQKTISDNSTHYTFMVYNVAHQPTVFDEEHPLCHSLNDCWNIFNTTYRRVSKNSTGFSGQTVEIYKPAIYNAVVKADKYIRKAVGKGEIQREEAVAMLKHILDCANALSTEHDTKAIEKEIAGAKTPELIIRFFSQVELEYV